jgi:hypothetical protein
MAMSAVDQPVFFDNLSVTIVDLLMDEPPTPSSMSSSPELLSNQNFEGNGSATNGSYDLPAADWSGGTHIRYEP